LFQLGFFFTKNPISQPMKNPENFVANKSLSKSNYVKGLQCQKALWFSKNRQDLKTPLDDKTKSKFETGD
jgi:hypothetical protein